ncbi:MAG: hypothetical protein Q8N15_02770 [Bacillota bacterium]|nr:hypothetical protein [Bacillota bacterium]
MATYAKGFKKQSSEMMLLKIIVGVIGAVLVIVLAAFLYDLSVTVGSYDDYTHITQYDDILSQVDADSEPLQDYIIYFYNDECPSCATIQKDALRLVARINKNDTVVFFVNTAEITEAADGDRDDFLGAIYESSLRTPMLVIVNDGDFEEVAVGSTDVLAMLTNVKNGDYDPFN